MLFIYVVTTVNCLLVYFVTICILSLLALRRGLAKTTIISMRKKHNLKKKTKNIDLPNTRLKHMLKRIPMIAMPERRTPSIQNWKFLRESICSLVMLAQTFGSNVDSLNWTKKPMAVAGARSRRGGG